MRHPDASNVERDSLPRAQGLCLLPRHHHHSPLSLHHYSRFPRDPKPHRAAGRFSQLVPLQTLHHNRPPPSPSIPQQGFKNMREHSKPAHDSRSLQRLSFSTVDGAQGWPTVATRCKRRGARGDAPHPPPPPLAPRAAEDCLRLWRRQGHRGWEAELEKSRRVEEALDILAARTRGVAPGSVQGLAFLQEQRPLPAPPFRTLPSPQGHSQAAVFNRCVPKHQGGGGRACAHARAASWTPSRGRKPQKARAGGQGYFAVAESGTLVFAPKTHM
mmetsp:Transcript_37536/g.91248  ORF Transcript_37536/g.91248 Transcript_37536/m.91248 type:complete len:272 (+) Transcript_37536:1183-1998(+)